MHISEWPIQRLDCKLEIESGFPTIRVIFVCAVVVSFLIESIGQSFSFLCSSFYATNFVVAKFLGQLFRRVGTLIA